MATAAERGREFAILERNNHTVFEDDEIAVCGLLGDFFVDCGGMYGDGTTFVAVADGELVINQEYRLYRGMYASLPAGHVLKGVNAIALIVHRKEYEGLFALGGPLEERGRLRYIDGCTDTGLIQPPKKGEACLNGLFFPPGIQQTRHYHPSHRVGLVYDGQGLCHAHRTSPMRPGDLFIIPKRAWHGFETAGVGMRIIAFHPDSDFGATDESHQMLDATLTG
jgi:quercetin dioxygenase-like cupin family protein